MEYSLNSTLLLTILLFIGLFFFLRASSKDRTTTVEITSSKMPIEVLDIICNWLTVRGWKQVGGDSTQQKLEFKGEVVSSKLLAIFLTLLGGLGSCSLGLVIVQLYPRLGWWPLLLGLIGGPLSGWIYFIKSRRVESFELKLMDNIKRNSTALKIRAHRDELIALDSDLKDKLDLESDGSLFKTPI